MNTSVTSAVASEHIADLRRAAEHQRAATNTAAGGIDQRSVTLRLAQPKDEYDVSRLAQLDEAPTPVGPVMLAVVDGEAVAALSLSDGQVVANPFVATQQAVTLLRRRAAQSSGGRKRHWPRILRPRFA